MRTYYRDDGILLAIEPSNRTAAAKLVAEDDIAKKQTSQPAQPPQSTTTQPATISSPTSTQTFTSNPLASQPSTTEAQSSSNSPQTSIQPTPITPGASKGGTTAGRGQQHNGQALLYAGIAVLVIIAVALVILLRRH